MTDTEHYRANPHKMFERGEPIKTVQEAVGLILAGEWLFFRHKPIHPSWASGWGVSAIRSWIGAGYLRRATLTDHGRKVIEKRKAKQEPQP